MVKKRLFRRKRERMHIGYQAKRRIIIGFAIFALIALYLFKSVNFVILSASAVGLVVLFYLVDYMFDVRFKTRHYFFITFIAITGFLLSDLYWQYPSYDKILHFILPTMFASICFRMVSDLEIKLKWRLVFVFFIVTGTVGVFEIGEWTLDQFFGLDLQGVTLRNIQEFGEEYIVIQEPLDDTMIDMSLGMLGAALYCFTIFFFFRKKVEHYHY